MKPFVTGLVLAAGGSTRLGRPKQLLPYGRATLLDHVLDTARRCPFDELLCVIGGSAADVRSAVSFDGVRVVENPDFGEGVLVVYRGRAPRRRRALRRAGADVG